MSPSLLKIQIDTSETPTIGFDVHFFNSSCFLKTKTFATIKLFVKGKPNGMLLTLAITGDRAVSGLESTFGGIELEDKAALEVVPEFINQTIAFLHTKGVRTLVIRNYPGYWPFVQPLHQQYLHIGFRVEAPEVNHHIPITCKLFNEVASYNERKKIRQCERNGFTFEEVGPENLADIYELVVATRVRKKFAVSMTYQKLENALKSCPDHYKLFVVKDKQKIIAASVSVVLSDKVLYNFYHADDSAYRNYSPVAFLVAQIYAYCQVHDFNVLDLGISSVEGVLNEGLARFKRNLGGITTNKYTYIKSL